MPARYAALLALLIAVLPAHGSNLEKPGLRVAVGGKALVAYLPLTIAEQRGYFAATYDNTFIDRTFGPRAH